jgi:hypothetical protein
MTTENKIITGFGGIEKYYLQTSDSPVDNKAGN